MNLPIILTSLPKTYIHKNVRLLVLLKSQPKNMNIYTSFKFKNVLFALLLLISVSIYNSYGQQNVNRALLVIDVQGNLLNPKSAMHIDTSGINTFISNVNNAVLTNKIKGNPVLYVVNEWTNPVMNFFTGNTCKKGAAGVGLDKRLLIAGNKIYSKSKPNALTNKDLYKFLTDNKITEVCIVGLMAEGCVKATAMGLKSHNFDVVVIENALGSKSLNKKNKIINYFHKHNIIII